MTYERFIRCGSAKPVANYYETEAGLGLGARPRPSPSTLFAAPPPQKVVNWFHPQWVGPGRWATQDDGIWIELTETR